ncbi:MAG: long-chain fatty acid--CoA ligase, partial [Desulfobacterales bacterium]|nr:long-chain fatty acid--CoA ligase [Desulfobacterales bacterium]
MEKGEKRNLELMGESIPRVLGHRVDASPDAIAFREREEGRGWRKLTWAQFYRDVRGLAAGLMARGLEPGDQVAIFMKNSAEWEMAQHAVFLSGGVVVGLDGNDPVERLKKIARLTRIQALFIDDASLSDRLPDDFLASLKLIVEKNDIPAPAPRGPVHRTPFSEVRNHPPAPLPPDHGG